MHPPSKLNMFLVHNRLGLEVAALLLRYRKIPKLVEVFSYFWIEKIPRNVRAKGDAVLAAPVLGSCSRQLEPGPTKTKNGPFTCPSCHHPTEPGMAPQEQFRHCFSISQSAGSKRNFNGV